MIRLVIVDDDILIRESLKIIIGIDEEGLISSAIKHNSNGYLLKSSKPDKIISGIKSVYMGNGVFEADIVSKLVINNENKEENNKDNILKEYDLSEREKEVVKLIARGLSNKEIAGEIFLSEGTVKNHITSILSKMDLKHRTQIAITYLNGKS